MSALNRQFHIQQARLKRGVSGRKQSPAFLADVLCSIETKSNRERWLEYQSKLMNREVAA